MSTTSITQQQQVQQGAPTAVRRSPRTNPWQRVLALLALVPAVVGVGVYVAAVQNHKNDGTGLLELSIAFWAFGAAASLALIWLVVGAIDWQIKEAVRNRG